MASFSFSDAAQGGGFSQGGGFAQQRVSPAKTSGQFKSGWSEAQDAAGDTYYFNKITQETTWERHLVMV